SPVLPWTERAYETCLSAGSTAFKLWKWSPHPELHQAGLLTEQAHRSKCFGGMKMVGARRLARPRLPDSESGGSAIPREPRAEKMASLTGFAPVISCMRGRRVD